MGCGDCSRIKKVLILIFLLVLTTNLAAAVSYDDKSTITSIVTLANDFSIISDTSHYYIDHVNATLLFYPKEDVRQTVSYIKTDPKTASLSADEGTIGFYFDAPSQTTFEIKTESEVKTKNEIQAITKKVNFPVVNVPSSYYQYMQATQTLDITPEIRDVASELSSGKEDLYGIEYAFAEYVRKNVKYDLNSITQNANQKSSWVLKNKEGVCDEITNLFISLNRASGIPARFVSGIAYTNLDIFGKKWVAHAWAEVYFPEYGWVPYDVTYGEYGFIDAGHIKLLESYDSATPSVRFEYAGKDIRLQTNPIDIDVNVLNYGTNTNADYSFTASLYNNRVGFNSYDLVVVDVTNNKNYYQVADLYLGKTEKIKIFDESEETISNEPIHRQEILLKPFETKRAYWMIMLEGDFSSKYSYTFPIIVYNSYNETSTAQLQSENDYQILYYDDVSEIMKSQEEESSKAYSKNVLLECFSDKDEIYLEDMLKISCTLDNKGDKAFDNVNICLDNSCQQKKLGIETLSFFYDKNFTTEGIKTIQIKAYNDELLKTYYATINVLDKPKIRIYNITYPATARFDDTFDIGFSISKESASNPKNIKVTVTNPVMKKEWFFSALTSDKSFRIISDGAAMKMNDNQYTINVAYQDEKNNNYLATEKFTIKSEANFGQKIILALNVAGYWIESLFTG